MPTLNNRVPVLAGNLVPIPGVPDTKQHAAEVTGVVEEPPAEQQSQRVEQN